MTQTNTPKEQTAEICDEIRAELGLKENEGAYTLTQTEKKAILTELRSMNTKTKNRIYAYVVDPADGERIAEITSTDTLAAFEKSSYWIVEYLDEQEVCDHDN